MTERESGRSGRPQLGALARGVALVLGAAVAGVTAWRIWDAPAGPVADERGGGFDALLARQGPPDPAPVPPPTGLTEPFNCRGRVLDPTGVPVAGARVYRVELGATPAPRPEPDAVTDAAGVFEFASTRPTIASWIDAPGRTDPRRGVRLLATAPGFGPGFVRPGRLPGGIVISLAPDDRPIRGRVLDPAGRPVAGARITGRRLFVPRLADRDGPGVASWLAWLRIAKLRYDWFTAENKGLRPGPSAFVRLPEGVGRDHPVEGFRPGPGAPARLPREFRWIESRARTDGLDEALAGADLAVVIPGPIVADADGRYEVRGVGRDRVLLATVEGPGIATQEVYLVAEPSGPPLVIGPDLWGGDGRNFHAPPAGLAAAYGADPDRMSRGEPLGTGFEPSSVVLGADATLVARPGRGVAGVVRDLASGRPLAGVEVGLEVWVGPRVDPNPYLRATSAADGRYRIDGLRDDSVALLVARPAPGVPWLAVERGVTVRANPAGAEPAPIEVDFALTRGVWAEGRVTDAATGGPRAGARVEGWAFAANPLARRDDPTIALVEHHAEVDDRGRFRLLVCPGPGLITAAIANATRPGDITGGQVGVGAEAIAGHRDPAHQAAIATVPRRLFPRHVNTIEAIDPAPDAEALAVDLPIRRPGERPGAMVEADGRPATGGFIAANLAPGTRSGARGGTFVVRGLVPGRLRRVLFTRADPPGVALLEVRDADGPPLRAVVQPPGRLKVTIDGEGHPGGVGRLMEVLDDGGGDPFFPDSNPLHPALRRAVGPGRFEVDGLVPGLAYRLQHRPTEVDPPREVARKIRVRPGETLDLGTIRLAPP